MTTSGTQPRRLALEALRKVLERRRPLDEALEALPADLDPRDRALIRASVTGALRHLQALDALLESWLERPVPAEAIAITQLLRIGLTELLVLQVPPHAVLHTTGEVAKTMLRGRFAGLVNAILRRAERAGPQALPDVPSAPQWMVSRWVDHYGIETTDKILAAHLVEPPLDLTVKAAAQTVPEGAQVWPGTVRLPSGSGRIEELPGFADGHWWVQDAAAAIPVRALLAALADRDAPNVIDLCAAPGGKTAQLTAAGCQVTAVDRSGPRLQRLSENMARLALDPVVVQAKVEDFIPATTPDAVLLDAPCSATGTIRRHPELPYLRDPTEITKLAGVQTRLLDRAAGLLESGGLLMYAVCSLEPEEGDAQLQAFIQRHADFDIVPMAALVPDVPAECFTAQGCLRALPYHLAESGGMDGFFAVLLKKTS